MRVTTLFFCFLIFPIVLYGQTNIPDFNIRWFNTENGLPANGIKGIQWDPETELIWIATEAGIARFNGTEFNLYTRNNTPFLSSERINFIVKNNAGKIYLTENYVNVIRVDRNKLIPYPIIDQKKIKNSNSLYGLTISETYFKHLSKYGKERQFTLPFDKVAPIDDSSALIVRNYRVYFSDIRNKELVAFDFNDKKAKGIFKTHSKLYLVDSANKIYAVQPGLQKSTEVKLELEGINSNTQLPQQAVLIWENGQSFPIIINGNNAWKLVEINNTLKGVKICTQVPTDALIKNFLYLEDKGVIVIGTDSKGIAVLQQNSVKTIRNQNLSNRTSNSYYAQIELSDGSVLTGQGHRLGLNLGPTPAIPIQKIFSNSVYLTTDSFLWYQQGVLRDNTGGIFSYNLRTKQRKLELAINEGNGFAVWKQKDTTLIFSAEEIIQTTPEKKIIRRHPIELYSKSDPITSLVLDNKRIAIASCNGLVFFNKDNYKTDTILSLPNYCIRSLSRYQDYIFIGTYGDGIYLHKINEKTIKVPIDKKRSALYAHCFVIDSFGYVWISTNRGLLKANINDLLSAYHQPNKEIYYHYFGIADGMITSEMNGGCHPCALQLKNGYLSFPTMDGLLWVNPKNVSTPTQGGILLVDEIRANEKLIESSFEKLKFLPFSTKQLSIKLSYAAWSNRENIYLYYRLRPNESWKEVSYSTPSLIEINNIEPGDYELQIRKLNGFGSNNNSLLTIPFHIETPWYNKWWFYGTCVLSLYGMIMLYLSIRTRQLQLSETKLKSLVEEKTIELTNQNQVLEKNNRIMSRLISIISHDIVTPLKFIQVAGKNLLSKKEKIAEDLKQETLAEITHTAQELQNLSTNILNWIRFQRKNRLLQQVNFSPFEITEQVIRILGPSARIKNIYIENKIDTSLTVHQYAEPFRILSHNLLSNAINFSEKGSITISLLKNTSSFQLKVADQGVGMTEDQIENILQEDLIISSATVDNRKGHGLGYQIIKDLTGLIDASLGIKSQKGVGTTVTITFQTTKP